MILFAIGMIIAVASLMGITFNNSTKVVELEQRIKFLEKQLKRIGEKK